LFDVTDASPVSPPRAWAEVNLAALRSNLQLARQQCGCAVMVVVKAGAYGHGLEEVVQVLAAEDVAFIGVANVGEARRVRAIGVETPIYLLGPTWSEERPEIVDRDWVPCVSSLEEAADFDRLAKVANKTLSVHLAVDTGMGRGGFVVDDMDRVMTRLSEMKHISIDGIGSHLPSADEDEEFTRSQMKQFQTIIDGLGGVERFQWRHLLNSAGLMGYQRGCCNLARPGLMLYGASTLPDVQKGLSTVMTLKSRVTLIRTLPAGHGISYGRQFITEKPTRVATIGIGYGDGYPRHVSGQGADVWVRGNRCGIIGRVTMDQVMVDVTHHEDVQEGDEVEMFGANIPVAEIAEKAGTIEWEVFTGITPRVTRCYVDE